MAALPASAPRVEPRREITIPDEMHRSGIPQQRPVGPSSWTMRKPPSLCCSCARHRIWMLFVDTLALARRPLASTHDMHAPGTMFRMVNF